MAMEYKQQQRQQHGPPSIIKPRLIIHGGAGNITSATLSPDQYREYRTSLLTIVSKTNEYMHTPVANPQDGCPTALDAATYAVALLEDNPLFNAGHGAVFTRDGINELEASVMVSRGFAKRCAAVTGLRMVKNPIKLARKILEHGDQDLTPTPPPSHPTSACMTWRDVPSAQGHALLHGETAETLARQYGLEMVDHGYFFTQKRWDEHIRGLERERDQARQAGTASWSSKEYLTQGTVGAIALDEKGVLCCATSTGGLTNKLTGRIGDTPCPGAGFWAEEWTVPTPSETGPAVVLSDSLRGLIADCLPTPLLYRPAARDAVTTTRGLAVSGTGNGDSFLRTAAARTACSMARFAGQPGNVALTQVTGPGGELQKSAGHRWGRTGEGEGGMIGIECTIVRDSEGDVVEAKTEILQDYNCGGMFRAWVDDSGAVAVRIFRDDIEPVSGAYRTSDVNVGLDLLSD
ncbi:Isoaspartyl peptidase [Diplogelasinospora grovesii]|uniref:Isoaspartyl peptidase n=1 Tax=Diplogelasinospora grovesii TaxID=303347 RepID=A0AAN6N901_9PEZI|nr:Isoaspartyl peptidase [Diplogelasinospora grovesii]